MQFKMHLLYARRWGSIVTKVRFNDYRRGHPSSEVICKNGVNKIRLTGGEPLLRKDIPVILEALKKLPVHLSITTNAVLVDRYIHDLKAAGVDHINVSLDTLQTKQFDAITKRNHFDRAYNNILLTARRGF
jgi:molybdenum cofactor biosynthesis enzyme MoaA